MKEARGMEGLSIFMLGVGLVNGNRKPVISFFFLLLLPGLGLFSFCFIGAASRRGLSVHCKF
jgi:hypothetical protein